MLIKSNQLAQCLRGEFISKNRIRWAIAIKDPVRHKPIRRTFRLNLLCGLAESQRLALCEDICHENIVMPSKRIQGLGKSDEVTRDERRSLMNQLIERMLSIG